MTNTTFITDQVGTDRQFTLRVFNRDSTAPLTVNSLDGVLTQRFSEISFFTVIQVNYKAISCGVGLVLQILKSA